VHFDAAVVINQAQFSKFIHEEIHARPGCSDHLCKRLLAALARVGQQAIDPRRLVWQALPDREQTSRLGQVVMSLAMAQGNLNLRNLSDLLQALDGWRQHEPKEFASRGGTNGVAYRLWMEAKQVLRN
jgi:hypothetical protein